MLRRSILSVKTLVVLGIVLTASSVYAVGFGQYGQTGQRGFNGSRGRDGQDVVLKAEGIANQYDISGSDGLNGGIGQDGYRAAACTQPQRPAYNVEGAYGGSGGDGGVGGDGGNGGGVTVYYENLDNVKLLSVRSIPGRAGHGAWGGRGADGCRCQVYSWTITTNGQNATYHCTDGMYGRNGYQGRDGAAGRVGRVTLIPQLTPVLVESPTQLIDMPKMEAQGYTLSQNKWEARTGAKSLFAPGSYITDSYTYYVGRNEAKVKLVWAATRPITDFNGYKMRISLDGTTARLAFPSGLWTDVQSSVEDGVQVFKIKAVVASNELGALSFERFTGIGDEHEIDVKDSAGMADVLMNSVKLQYFTAANGQYQKRFDTVVPADALEVSPSQIKIKMNRLGLSSDLFKQGTNAYAGLVVTRKLADQSVSYQLATYYVIKDTLNIGDKVQVLQDSSLMSGNQVVGSVKKGEQYLVNKIQGDWIGLKKEDNTSLTGWIQSDKLGKIR